MPYLFLLPRSGSYAMTFAKSMMSCALLATTLTFAEAQKKNEKKAAASLPDRDAGKITFQKYCISCHGPDGKGNGPAASALKTPPTDLTSLTKTHEGRYPAGFVSAVLKFGRNLAAHGSPDMPVWGSLFKAVDPVRDPTGQKHVDDLVAYIESLQVK
jgi:mono/diheme cytochrome c family protein